MPVPNYPAAQINSPAVLGYVAIAASVAASTQVRTGPSTLLSVNVVTSGGGQVQIFDVAGTTATGSALYAIANAQAVGPVNFTAPLQNGCLVVSSASSPAVTVVTTPFVQIG